MEAIEAKIDSRTTVMFKSLPRRLNGDELLGFIAQVCPRRVDFIYVKMDTRIGRNLGTAFVNFMTPDDLLSFAKARLGTKWEVHSSSRVVQMIYANYQGKRMLTEVFRNSPAMNEREAWRPKIFYSDGPDQGLPEAFPPPTHNQHKPGIEVEERGSGTRERKAANFQRD
ncbi:hypothetical protein DENSPDRAFT_774332 [Dentipellis sp. KUC8613]|nr:hypothetical protein DENSPDRAFT_774332 [Dentipellis sp. KUC8613]